MDINKVDISFVGDIIHIFLLGSQEFKENLPNQYISDRKTSVFTTYTDVYAVRKALFESEQFKNAFLKGALNEIPEFRVLKDNS